MLLQAKRGLWNIRRGVNSSTAAASVGTGRSSSVPLTAPRGHRLLLLSTSLSENTDVFARSEHAAPAGQSYIFDNDWLKGKLWYELEHVRDGIRVCNRNVPSM